MEYFLLIFSQLFLFVSLSLSRLFISDLSLTLFLRSLEMFQTDLFNFVEADIVVKLE